jgi:hypothetical protein
MPAEPKASANLAAETGSSPVKLRYLDSVNLIERLHRRLLEVIKDDLNAMESRASTRCRHC